MKYKTEEGPQTDIASFESNCIYGSKPICRSDTKICPNVGERDNFGHWWF